MSVLPEVADVALVRAIAETGSIGAAAAQLHVAQPSASQRLGVLERRLGVRLVDRDTTGAQLTEAGVAFLDKASRGLALLEEAVAAAQAPTGRHLSVGTIGSLAPAVFTALLGLLPGTRVREVTNHGAVLAQAVADGALDACVIGLPSAAAPARGATRILLGIDDLVLVQPAGAALGSGSNHVRGVDVTVASYSNDADAIAARLARLGAIPRVCNGTLTALAMARQLGALAAVPRSTALPDVRQGERIRSMRIRVPVQVWQLTRGAAADELVARAAELGAALGLSTKAR